MAESPLDVAVVGAGVSGLYTAWRLLRQDPNRSITVFESGNEVGGRLLSVRPPGISDMVAELGGMRILPAVQPLIGRLLDDLRKDLLDPRALDTYEFPVDQDQNIAYLRGIHLRLSDFARCPEKVPYALSFLERGMKPSSVILNAIEQIVPGVTRQGLSEAQRRELTRQARFRDAPLHTQGFWNVLMRVISGEAYQLGVDAGGYSSTLTNWNAYDAIPWYLSDFGVSARYQGFSRGFQEVPKSLATLFESAGGRVLLGTPLRGFRPVEGGFELSFGGDVVTARELVLAMPRRSLELIAPASPVLEPIRALIESVTARPLFKLFTTYKDPWWRAAGFIDGQGQTVSVEAGRSVTDLPVRQTYYWSRNDGSPARSGPAMLMASYDDGTNIGFWDGLRSRRQADTPSGSPGEESAPASFVQPGYQAAVFAGSTIARNDPKWDRCKAPRVMVAEVARQLAAMHGLTYTPDVLDAAFRDWGQDPFGGGWNSWNIGVESWKVKEKIVQPFDNHRLFICGEAYSDAQGWVEGALQTADMVLKRFNLGPL